MAGNVPKLLTDSAEKKQLTDFLVSISPSVSHKFWLSMCEKYAEQLIEEQRYVKSGLYFVLCGKLYDALGTLSQNGKLLDALALARARLPESDPFIKNLLCKISHQFSIRKEIENEAVCYIALKNPLHAAKVMNCAGDAKYTYASVYICNKFNLPEATQEYAVICVEKCLSQNDWPTFYKVAEIVESVKVYKILVRVHEIIASQIKTLKKEEAAVASEIFGVTGSKILIWNGKTPENSNLSFLAHIHDVLKSEGLLPDDKEILQNIREALNSMETNEKSKVHINVAIYVCQIIIISLLDDLSSATKYFEKIFHCSYNVVYMPKVICWIFFPLDLYWCSNKNTFLCEIKKMDTGAVPFALHFENIFNSVCKKFECTDMSNSELCIVSPDIMTSIEVVQLILTLLSKKTVEDSLLLYFSSQYLNELERIAKKGYKFRCYEKDAVYDITPEVNTYTYNFESRSWTRNSDANVEESVSLEDAIKHAEQSGFQLPACENTTESASQNASSITDVITQVFSSEMDSISKDELVQRYGFKHVSDFLQKVMTCEETTSNLENQISVELSSVENTNGQITECTEDEYLHAQCWTDISLYYVLTKSFFSIICRDEYALLYYLKKYLLSLDTKIADLVRLQSANNSSQKPSASKVTLTSNQAKKPGVVIQSEKFSNSFENNSSDSLSTDSVLKDADSKDIVLNVSKLESQVNVNNEAVTLEEGEVNLCHENERVKLENEIDLVNGNKLPGEDPDNLPAESNADCENASYVIGESETKPIDVIVSNDNAILENAVIFSNKNGEEKLKTENEFDLPNEKERKRRNVIGESETKPIDVIVSNDNVISDNAVIFSNKNGEEKVKTENELDLLNEKERNQGSFTSNNSDRSTDCNSNDCGIKMNELQHRSDSIQDDLRTQYERISGHIKLLELEEFWYPDPFVSVTDLKSICINIFHKHPCKLIKNKFHELVHEVNLWYARYSFIEKPEICEICQKVSA